MFEVLTEKKRDRVDLEDLFEGLVYIDKLNFLGDPEVKTAYILLREVAGGCFNFGLACNFNGFVFLFRTWELSSRETFDSSNIERFVKLCLEDEKSVERMFFIRVIEGFDDIFAELFGSMKKIDGFGAWINVGLDLDIFMQV